MVASSRSTSAGRSRWSSSCRGARRDSAGGPTARCSSCRCRTNVCSGPSTVAGSRRWPISRRWSTATPTTCSSTSGGTRTSAASGTTSRPVKSDVRRCWCWSTNWEPRAWSPMTCGSRTAWQSRPMAARCCSRRRPPSASPRSRSPTTARSPSDGCSPLDGARPDGIALDAEGAVWVASPVTGELLRVAEGGAVLEGGAAPNGMAQACALGGPDGRTLFACCSPSHDPIEAAEGRSVVMATRVDVPAA